MGSPKPETIFRGRVRKLLEKLPNSWWESIQQRTILGTPDIIGCVNGLFVGLELKATPDSPITEMQIYKLKKIAAAGGMGFVVHPMNFDKTYELLAHLAEKNHDQSDLGAAKPSTSSERAIKPREDETRPDGGIPC